MIALRAQLNEFNEIGCALHAQIILADPYERPSQRHFTQRMQTRFTRRRDLNLSLEKQVELSGKWTFGATRSLRYGLNTA